VQTWWTTSGDLLLIASTDRIVIDAMRCARACTPNRSGPRR
jgi:hypothetical protein